MYLTQGESKIEIVEPFFADVSLIEPKFIEKNLKDRVRSAICGLVKFYFENFAYDKYVLVFISH